MRKAPSCRSLSVFLALACLLGAAHVAAAGDVLKVTATEAPILASANIQSTVLARVKQGTILELIGKENDWYKVVVPGEAKLRLDGPNSGYISARLVQVVPDSQAKQPTAAGGGTKPTVAGAAAQPGRVPPRARKIPTVYRVFGEGAVEWFAATKSFEAIVGNATGVFYGGGVDVIFKGKYDVQLDITHYQKNGQRVIVFNNEVFPLGIAEKISITPVSLNLAYRFKKQHRFTPYVGAGIGAYIYNENSGLAGSDTKTTALSYQVLGGVESSLSKSLSLALEVQYQRATGVLGDSGVSADYGEKDASGTSIRVKLLFGK